MDGAQISIHAGGISAAARAGNQPSGDSSRLPGHGLCGGVPAEPEPPRFRRFRRVPEAGAEQTAQPVRRGGAGRRGAFQRRVPFACFRGGPSSSPCSVLTAVSFPSPFRVSGKVLPENVPRRFGPPEFRSPCRVWFRRLSLRSRSVPLGQAMVCVFRRSAAAFPTPVVKDALMDIGQKPDH